MKISRNGLGFVSVLTAGLLLAGATVLLPSASTFGSETDAERAASIEHNIQLLSKPPAPPVQAPVPPAAPIDAPSAPAPAPSAGSGDVTGSNETPSGLPSAGNGGYLNRSESAGLGYMLIGLGATLMGSGSLVWAYSRRNR